MPGVNSVQFQPEMGRHPCLLVLGSGHFVTPRRDGEPLDAAGRRPVILLTPARDEPLPPSLPDERRGESVRVLGNQLPHVKLIGQLSGDVGPGFCSRLVTMKMAVRTTLILQI